MALTEQDLEQIKTLLDRSPTKVEEIVFDTMWSEHCSYKSSKPVLKTLPTKGSEVVLGVGEDSGIVYFCTHEGKKYCIAVSHESHNHPSQVLPIEGAATGVGGVVRDVYCMGADVIGVLDSLHFGIPETASNPALVSEIAERVVKGVSDYGNPLGVPVLGGETLYHPSYNDNCLVNVAALGLVEQTQIIRSKVPVEAKTEPYDMILIGKSTDSTGFGGASFSSTILDEEDEMTNMGAVQVHDPFLKRVIVEASKALMERVSEKKIAIGYKDLGAGGISCACSELASAGGMGAILDLDKVNAVSDQLPPEVIACSETQERFCIVVPRWFSEEVLHLFNEEFALPRLYHKAGASVIGEVISEPRFQLMHKGEMVCDLSVEQITTEVLAERHAAQPERKVNAVPTPPLSKTELEAICQDMLESLNQASKRYVYRNYDNAVRGDTVVYPGEADAVVITPVTGCETALAVSMDSNLYGFDDPYLAGAGAVAESIRNIVAVGASPLALTDCLNYGNPENPDVFWTFEEGVRGIGEAAKALSFIDGEPVPIVSGNVSFYNESKGGNAVVPSPVIMSVGRVHSALSVCTMQLKKEDSQLVFMGYPTEDFVGTEFGRALEALGKPVPGYSPYLDLAKEAKQNRCVHEAIVAGLVLSCHDVSGGGLWQCVAEMALGERGKGNIGVHLNLEENIALEALLFSESGGYVLEVANNNLDDFLSKADAQGVSLYRMGHTKAVPVMTVTYNETLQFELPIRSLKSSWNKQNLSHPGTPV